jgi:hypothetical protein
VKVVGAAVMLLTGRVGAALSPRLVAALTEQDATNS